MSDSNLILNGFSIISFNNDFDISSIKYENYEFENDEVSKVNSYRLKVNEYQSFSLQDNSNTYNRFRKILVIN